MAEALTTVRAIAPTARIVVRGDAKFYTADLAAVAARYAAHVSLTTGSNPSVHAAMSQMPQDAWTAICYPDAFVDEDTGELVSDAEVAETGYTAFTSHPPNRQVPGRLIVRRVKRLNPTAGTGQDELFALWRHHAVFVTSPVEMLQAEAQHRGHAIVEQVIADAAGSSLAHLPSGVFTANAAWSVLWAIAHNLTRAASVLAGGVHARATTATLRPHLINVPVGSPAPPAASGCTCPSTGPGGGNLHAAIHRPPPGPDKLQPDHAHRTPRGQPEDQWKAGQTGDWPTPTRTNHRKKIKNQSGNDRLNLVGGFGLSQGVRTASKTQGAAEGRARMLPTLTLDILSARPRRTRLCRR